VAVEERDPHTGYLTTGHEWNGIKELNTPVPRAVYFFLVTTALFAIGYWILMPAWPLGVSYTRGLLGIDQRTAVSQSLKQAALDRATWTKRIQAEAFDEIRADPGLMRIVRETGRTLFGDNCAACHGATARGSKGFPDLTTSSRLWGGTAEQIFQTIRVGVNSAHPDSRTSQMPAFGRDQILRRNDIENVAAFVYSLSLADAGKRQVDAAAVKAGEKVFAANCASCHGDSGRGNTEVGAPDLTDRSWIYGGDLDTIYATVWGGRQGHMPTWGERLTELDRKILTLYVLDLRRESP
jgi:cytochrome c oxidase cbb3-type subunit 3